MEDFLPEEYKEKLSSFIQIPEEDIEIKVAPGSIIVTAIISAGDEQLAKVQDNLETLSSEDASDVLGVTVLTIKPITTLVDTDDAADTDVNTLSPVGERADSSTRSWLVYGLISAGLVLCLPMAMCYRRRRQKIRRRKAAAAVSSTAVSSATVSSAAPALKSSHSQTLSNGSKLMRSLSLVSSRSSHRDFFSDLSIVQEMREATKTREMSSSARKNADVVSTNRIDPIAPKIDSRETDMPDDKPYAIHRRLESRQSSTSRRGIRPNTLLPIPQALPPPTSDALGQAFQGGQFSIRRGTLDPPPSTRRQRVLKNGGRQPPMVTQRISDDSQQIPLESDHGAGIGVQLPEQPPSPTTSKDEEASHRVDEAGLNVDMQEKMTKQEPQLTSGLSPSDDLAPHSSSEHLRALHRRSTLMEDFSMVVTLAADDPTSLPGESSTSTTSSSTAPRRRWQSAISTVLTAQEEARMSASRAREAAAAARGASLPILSEGKVSSTGGRDIFFV